MRVVALLTLLATVCLAAAGSEVYKWVDEEGNVHYSDTPPENTESERVQIDAAPPPGDGATERLLERAEQTRERLTSERAARRGDCSRAERYRALLRTSR